MHTLKDQLIGEIDEDGEISFFLFNETTCQSQVYQIREEFNGRMQEMKLKPLLWTRWYEKNWGFFITDGHILDKLTFSLVKVPLLVMFGIVMLIGLVSTDYSLRNKFNQATLFILGLMIVRIILDIYPSSI